MQSDKTISASASAILTDMLDRVKFGSAPLLFCLLTLRVGQNCVQQFRHFFS